MSMENAPWGGGVAGGTAHGSKMCKGDWVGQCLNRDLIS